MISSEEVGSLTDCLTRLLVRSSARSCAYYLQGYSYERIAAPVGRDCKTVDNALQRIKRKVDLHLESRRVRPD